MAPAADEAAGRWLALLDAPVTGTFGALPDVAVVAGPHADAAVFDHLHAMTIDSIVKDVQRLVRHATHDGELS